MQWWWDLLAAMDDHEGQAAWAQAVGSVGAIAAAIWIDRGGQRRAAEVRTAAAKAGGAARIEAMRRCAEVMARSVERLKALDLTNVASLLANPFEGLHSAANIVDFYIGRSGETEPRLVAALFDVQREMASAQAMLSKLGPVTLGPNIGAAISVSAETAARIRDIVDRCERGEG